MIFSVLHIMSFPILSCVYVMSRETISNQDHPLMISFNFLAKEAAITAMGHTLIFLACSVVCGSAVQLEEIADTKVGQ